MNTAKPDKVDNEKQTVPPLTEHELRVGRKIQARKAYEREFGKNKSSRTEYENRVRAITEYELSWYASF
jgi:hypothetical protein